ncbi:MAG: hypothetical protein AB1568_08250 [Thermodesulfobacteriota bacterium]
MHEQLPFSQPSGATAAGLAFIRTFLEHHPTPDGFLGALPFTGLDATGGSEHELQAVVLGRGEDIDLVRTINRSNYLANIVKRAASGEISRRKVEELQHFLNAEEEQVWENSWVRFPRRLLGPRADGLLNDDLRADKGVADSQPRSDLGKFVQHAEGEVWLRLPISYLLKLALADLLDTAAGQPDLLRRKGEQLLEHFTNDNSSPETVSFYVCSPEKPGRLGVELARESALRFLMSQTLAGYANGRFRLRENGQLVRVYFSPLPGGRQKKLNTLVSDSFYRELFMSPCLSGWQRGEEKHRYMALCHQTLSRSQLNGLGKLKEAGIITRNLVVLPNTSNISLANNGIHISLGSRKLGDWLQNAGSGFGPAEEKHFGDLAIKLVEHFLPLFVGTYSAAPRRIAYADFHPEVALGFLAHELDYTHLRMLWRRWKKKAAIKVGGQPLTPFGPDFIDRNVSRFFGLKGDYVPDFRLVDYFVCLLSTCRCPALDGSLGNLERLKNDLDDLGVFDRNMAAYLLYRLRTMDGMGYSGFEGRYYSLFPGFGADMAEAADLQVLLTAVAFRHILSGSVHHHDIPDDPTVESERRQIFFGAALGIPTFYVAQNTGNRFLKDILSRVEEIRKSRRYPGYLRVKNRAYRLALVRYLREEERDLVGMLDGAGLLASLEDRLRDEHRLSAATRMSETVLGKPGGSPLDLDAEVFNTSLEEGYRTRLRLQQIREALDCLNTLFRNAGRDPAVDRHHLGATVDAILGGEALESFLRRMADQFGREEEDRDTDGLGRLGFLITYATQLMDGRNRRTPQH